MSRTLPGVEQRRVLTPATFPEPFESPGNQHRTEPAGRARWSALSRDSWILRAVLIACATGVCYTLGPFGLRPLPAAGLGLCMAAVILLLEFRLRQTALSGLLGGALGGLLGMFAALLATFVISRTAEPEPAKSFLEYTRFVSDKRDIRDLRALRPTRVVQTKAPIVDRVCQGAAAPRSLLVTA